MAGKVKLTKRQIKEDKFTTFVLSTKERVEENWQFWVIGALAVVLVIVGAVYLINSGKNREHEAALKLAEAQSQYRDAQIDVAMLTLTQLLDRYEGTAAARQGRLFLARINYEQKNYAEAQRYFEEFLARVKDDPLNRAAALGGLGAVLENQGEYAAAAEKYAQAADEDPQGPLAPEYRYDAMRNYLAAGDIENARRQRDIIESEFKQTPIYSRAVELFAEESARTGS